MTYEEAIEMFSVAVTAELCERNRDLYRIAIKALEKQIPKKLIHITRNEHCEKVIGYRCPTCKADVTGSGFFCWKCGQALDWSDEK